MNAFGAGCRILLVPVLYVTATLHAQEKKPRALDLVYRSLDLKYRSLDLQGFTASTGGKAEGTAGAGSALRNEVVDLKAKGADVKESASEIKISLQGEILFDFDKSNLRPAAQSTLLQIAKLIQSYPNSTTLIDGFTDSKGSDSYNAKLSARRAASVKSWFVQHGIKANSMKTHGWGAAKPVAPNKHPDGSDNPEGRQKNRRVEITIKK
jgi:outer membrane protein OmpA-like peptidoglycan-associated protein